MNREFFGRSPSAVRTSRMRFFTAWGSTTLSDHTASSNSWCVTRRPARSTRCSRTANALGVTGMRSSRSSSPVRQRHWLRASRRNGGNSFIGDMNLKLPMSLRNTSYRFQQRAGDEELTDSVSGGLRVTGSVLQVKSGLCTPVAAETPASSFDIHRSLERRTIATPAIASSLTPVHPSEEATMMLRSRDLTYGDAGQSGFWPQNTNLRWVHMLSHRVAVICTMESTAAVARSCITPDSRARCAEGRWNRFLSLIAPRA